jgi:hypothetical protein
MLGVWEADTQVEIVIEHPPQLEPFVGDRLRNTCAVGEYRRCKFVQERGRLLDRAWVNEALKWLEREAVLRGKRGERRRRDERRELPPPLWVFGWHLLAKQDEHCSCSVFFASHWLIILSWQSGRIRKPAQPG